MAGETAAADLRPDPAERPRSVVRFPRVEFDLAGLVLGTVAVLALWGTWMFLAPALGVAEGHRVLTPQGPQVVPPAAALRSEFGARILRTFDFPGATHAVERIGYPGPLVAARPPEFTAWGPAPLGLPWWKIAIVGGTLLAVWGVVGGAIARVYAVRKTRDRTVPFDEALGFAFATLPQFLRAAFFIGAAGALTFGGIALCGAVAAIPVAGPVLSVVLHPLAVLLGVFLTVLAVGWVLGFPMTQAAVAVERNGSLDAASRTYSYVFTRPLPFAFGVLVVLAIGSLLPAFASWGLDAVREGVRFGAGWDGGGAAAAMTAGFDAASRLATPRLADGAPWDVTVWAWVAWAFSCFATLLAHGFATSYVVGGLVDVYLMLREEVDGVPATEVYEEGASASLGDPVPGQPEDAPDAPKP